MEYLLAPHRFSGKRWEAALFTHDCSDRHQLEFHHKNIHSRRFFPEISRRKIITSPIPQHYLLLRTLRHFSILLLPLFIDAVISNFSLVCSNKEQYRWANGLVLSRTRCDITQDCIHMAYYTSITLHNLAGRRAKTHRDFCDDLRCSEHIESYWREPSVCSRDRVLIADADPPSI